MKQPLVVKVLLAVVALGVLLSVASALAGALLRSRIDEPLPDLGSLLDYPGEVAVEDLAGAQRDQVIDAMMARPEIGLLRAALLEKGFVIAISEAQAMSGRGPST